MRRRLERKLSEEELELTMKRIKKVRGLLDNDPKLKRRLEIYNKFGKW